MYRRMRAVGINKVEPEWRLILCLKIDTCDYNRGEWYEGLRTPFFAGILHQYIIQYSVGLKLHQVQVSNR